MSDQQLEGLARRVRASGGIGEAEKQAVESFLSCALEGKCDPAGN